MNKKDKLLLEDLKKTIAELEALDKEKNKCIDDFQKSLLEFLTSH